MIEERAISRVILLVIQKGQQGFLGADDAELPDVLLAEPGFHNAHALTRPGSSPLL